jgi:hypothetical protein
MLGIMCVRTISIPFMFSFIVTRLNPLPPTMLHMHAICGGYPHCGHIGRLGAHLYRKRSAAWVQQHRSHRSLWRRGHRGECFCRWRQQLLRPPAKRRNDNDDAESAGRIADAGWPHRHGIGSSPRSVTRHPGYTVRPPGPLLHSRTPGSGGF